MRVVPDHVASDISQPRSAAGYFRIRVRSSGTPSSSPATSRSAVVSLPRLAHHFDLEARGKAPTIECGRDALYLAVEECPFHHTPELYSAAVRRIAGPAGFSCSSISARTARMSLID